MHQTREMHVCLKSPNWQRNIYCDVYVQLHLFKYQWTDSIVQDFLIVFADRFVTFEDDSENLAFLQRVKTFSRTK